MLNAMRCIDQRFAFKNSGNLLRNSSGGGEADCAPPHQTSQAPSSPAAGYDSGLEVAKDERWTRRGAQTAVSSSRMASNCRRRGGGGGTATHAALAQAAAVHDFIPCYLLS